MIFDTPYVEHNTGHDCFKLAGGKPPPRSWCPQPTGQDRGGATVGSVGSHNLLEAMEISLEVLGAAGTTSWSCTPSGRRNV
ncbi:unnamed protein product [Prunus armeniaca]